MAMSTGAREVLRIILWMCYVAQLLISCIYILLDVVTFVNIWQASGETVVDPLAVVYNNIWRAPLASCLLSALLTLSFNLLTCIVLIKKSINRSGPGFGYGFVLAYCFTLAFFCLLCSLVLDGFSDTVVNTLQDKNTTSWTSSTTQVYTGTEVFGFLCTAVYLVFSLILVIFQAAVSDQLGITDEMSNPYAGLPEVPTLFVPPAFKSDTPGFSAEQAAEQQYAGGGGQQQQNYGGGGGGSGYGAAPGYGQPVQAGYGQPAGQAAYGGGQQQYSAAYENEEYESEAQGLNNSNQHNSSSPAYNYRAAGTTF